MPDRHAPLITRCPDCATVFRATEAQLSARAGQVRCGRCGAVFDARARAMPTPQDATTGTPHPPAVAAAGAPTLPVAMPQPATREEPSLNFAQFAEPGAAPAEGEPGLPLPPVAVARSRTSAPSDQAERATKAVNRDMAYDFGPPRSAQRRLSRWFSWPATLLLLLALLAQVAFEYRGDLVLLFPQIKPYAERACAELRCDLPLPRRAELMSIESSDLQADGTNPGVMVLSVTLRNRAPFAQTPPALELTLTDTQDRAVARRVLSPADYSARGTAQNPFPASSEIPVKVYFDASAVKATGYRVYLFYP